ncbi:MAG: BatA and WFA domain-containing protein [Planctomycetota bacterium]|nr:BatA and WFA domain-containing protein [Planctomycetota bacterium]
MFLHPWAVMLGLAAVGLPFAVHWLTKPRPVRMPLSTLRFVLEAVRQHRARHRLRDFIVLALRAAAVLLVALAIARPKLGDEPLVSDSQSGSAIRVVVLDVSQSMAALDRGVEAIERARTIAAEHLRYRPGLRVNLILAGASPRTAFEQPSQNFEALRDELSQASVRPERLDINRVIAKAAEMLAADSEDDRRRELVVISDFQRSNWARADFSPLPQQTQIQLEATSNESAPANIALLHCQIQQRTAIGGATQLEIEIGNYSPLPQRITAEVAIGDATFRVEGMCPPNRRTTLAQEIQLQQAGWQVGTARLTGVEDALAADNERALVVEVTAKPTYALLTRQSASQRPSSSYYLERALAPDSQLGERASVEIVRVDPAAIDRERLTAADLLVIDHPGKLAAEDIGLLAGLLRRGRPVLYVAGEAIDATNLRLLVEAAGGGLQMPVDFAPPPQDQQRRDLFLTSVRQDVAPFDVFGESRQAITARLRFGGGLTSSRLENTLDDDLLATYSDGTACLVLTSSDAGALAVLNADLNRSNLPTSEAFVPLLDQLVQRLLQRRAAVTGAMGGEPVVVRLPSGVGSASELQIVGPLASESELISHGELVDEGIGVVWRWPSPDEPGVYRVERGDETVFALPVGLSAEESPLESLSPDVLKNRLAGTLAVHYRAAADPSGQRDVLWTWLLVACVVCIVGEFVTLTAFRS